MQASRLLCLTGPAGAGKTALIRFVAAQLSCELVEWTNPVHSAWKSGESNALPSRMWFFF